MSLIAKFCPASRALAGVRVLVVEDEALVAMLLEEAVLEAGGEVVGPARTLAEAMRLASGPEPLDAVTLDLNLAGANSAPVAAVLAARRIPYVVVSGYLGEGQAAVGAAAHVLVKPFRLDDLVTALSMALERRTISA